MIALILLFPVVYLWKGPGVVVAFAILLLLACRRARG